MNEVDKVNNYLTDADLVWLDTVRVSTADMPLDRPVRASKATTNPLLVPSLLVDARLSPETFQREANRLAKLEKKRASLRKRKPYTRKRGTVHPNRKKATRRRLLERQWAEKPYSCLVRSGGSWQLDRKQWDELVAPLWERWLPKDLTVKRYRGYGSMAKPYTVYTIDVLHREHGKLYDGNSQMLYAMSCGQYMEPGRVGRTGSEA